MWGLRKGDDREDDYDFTPQAIAHGKKYEKEGLKKYLQYRQTFDSTVTIEDCMGLTIREDYPEFGCSPDGLVFSQYNEPRLLEIKCPFSLKSVPPEKYEDVLNDNQKKTFCLEKNWNGDIVLKQEHTYYYQIQFSLGILGIEDADLVIYTLKDILVIPVKFDSNWWNNNVHQLKEFHHNVLVPEYFLMRTPRNLLPFEIDIHASIGISSHKEVHVDSEEVAACPAQEEASSESDFSSFSDFLNYTQSLKYGDSDQDLSSGCEFLDSNESLECDKSDEECPSDESIAYSVTFDDEGNPYF